MDRIPHWLLEEFVTQKYNWGGIGQHRQFQMAKELLRLREAIDADIDSGPELIHRVGQLSQEIHAIADKANALAVELKDWLDAFNTLTHRTSA